jgi:hypothetical protein
MSNGFNSTAVFYSQTRCQTNGHSSTHLMNEAELNGALRAGELAASSEYDSKGLLKFWMVMVALGYLPGLASWLSHRWPFAI